VIEFNFDGLGGVATNQSIDASEVVIAKAQRIAV
jgi:hypothetical protein